MLVENMWKMSRVPYRVYLTDSASRDLSDIDDYLCRHGSAQSADHVPGKIEDALNSLAELPERGSDPRELAELGIREYREIYYKPYRIIYRVLGTAIYVYVNADGRRDMQSLLSRRLLEG
jgi:toxin ParE1/3/4